MKCVSCEASIDPKWAHAIANNVCPSCGLAICPEHLKNLFASLSKTMQEMQQYPAELNDWLLSNYQYIKTDDPNLINYVPADQLKSSVAVARKDAKPLGKTTQVIKIKNPDTGKIEEQVIEVETLQSEAKTNEFFERAQAFTPPPKEKGAPEEEPKSVAEHTQHLKAVATKAKKEIRAGHSSPKGIISQADLASMIQAEAQGDAGLDIEVSQLEEAITGEPAIQYSDEDPSEPFSGDDPIPSFVLNMAASAGATKQSKAQQEARDLHDMQTKVANASKRLGQGSFSRG
jgi:hypothetical protein